MTMLRHVGEGADTLIPQTTVLAALTSQVVKLLSGFSFEEPMPISKRKHQHTLE